MVLPALRRKTLQKLWRKKTKKLQKILAKSKREEKLKNFLKKMFLKQSKNSFKKPEIQSSIDRKIDWINRNSEKIAF